MIGVKYAKSYLVWYALTRYSRMVFLGFQLFLKTQAGIRPFSRTASVKKAFHDPRIVK
jgi:hypothetical protein